MRSFSVTPLLPVVSSLMAGIALENFHASGGLLPFVLAVVVVAAMVCRRWPVVQSIAIYVCFVVLGMTLVQLQGDENISEQELHGVVMSEPMDRPKTTGIDLLVPKAGGRTLRCYLWKDERSREVRLGDALVVTLDNSSGINHSDNNHHPTLYFINRHNWHPGGTAPNQLSRWQRTRLWFLHQRHKLLERYRGFHAEEDAYAILAAMTLGDKSAQNRELRDTYSVSGASHILVISGLHVGIVYILLTWLMLGRRRFWLSQVLTVAAIWAFALLTGLSPSVCRAATMISLYAVFADRGGKRTPINVLCFAAIVMLIADAQTLFDISFQLSFSAVFAILLFMPLFQSIYQPGNVILRGIWNMGLISLCAQLGTAPLIAYYFNRLSTYFLLTNFLVIPAAMLILYGALLSLLFPPASVVLIQIVKAMNGGLRIIASLPGASIEGLHPTPLQVALMYVFILLCYLILRKMADIFNRRDRR